MVRSSTLHCRSFSHLSALVVLAASWLAKRRSLLFSHLSTGVRTYFKPCIAYCPCLVRWLAAHIRTAERVPCIVNCPMSFASPADPCTMCCILRICIAPLRLFCPALALSVWHIFQPEALSRPPTGIASLIIHASVLLRHALPSYPVPLHHSEIHLCTLRHSPFCYTFSPLTSVTASSESWIASATVSRWCCIIERRTSTPW